MIMLKVNGTQVQLRIASKLKKQLLAVFSLSTDMFVSDKELLRSNVLSIIQLH